METKLIYIGDKFYWQSGTMMSSIYSETGQRYDWGFVQRDLAEGKTVTIRPASAEEFREYQIHLDKIQEQRNLP